MTKASDLEVNIDVLDDDGLSQLRCRTCGKPVIGNLDGRGCPGCGWYIEQLVIDKDGWPVIVDGTPGRGLTGCPASTGATSKTCRTSSDRAWGASCSMTLVRARARARAARPIGVAEQVKKILRGAPWRDDAVGPLRRRARKNDHYRGPDSKRLDVPADYNSQAVAAALARRRHGGGKGVGRGDGQREAALQELHDRHASELWRFAMRLTHDRQISEDIVQEVLLKAWKDPSLGQHDQAEARGWLFTASRNLIIDRWRSAASQHEQRMEHPPEESAGDATSVVLDRWLIAEALASLSTNQRSVINAVYYEGRSIADISARLRSPEGTVKSRLHYGLRNLRLALQEKGVTRP